MGSNPARAETNSQAQVPCRDIYGKARAPETERQEFNKEKWARRERSERSQMREKDKERGQDPQTGDEALRWRWSQCSALQNSEKRQSNKCHPLESIHFQRGWAHSNMVLLFETVAEFFPRDCLQSFQHIKEIIITIVIFILSGLFLKTIKLSIAALGQEKTKNNYSMMELHFKFSL